MSVKKNTTSPPSYGHLFRNHDVLYQRGEGCHSTPLRAFTDADLPLLDQRETFQGPTSKSVPVEVVTHYRFTVRLPTWMTLEEWIANHVEWTYAWASGVDPRWPKAWQLSAFSFTRSQQMACHDLLNANLRSPFRMSLACTIAQWMETPPGQRFFQSPLSPSQWGNLLHASVEDRVKRMHEQVYANRWEPRVGVSKAYLSDTIDLRGIGLARVTNPSAHLSKILLPFTPEARAA